MTIPYKLQKEIDINTDEEKNSCSMDNFGNKVKDPRSTIPDKPPVDYQKEYQKYIKEKKDE